MQEAPEFGRPYIHPLRAPKAGGILTENAPGHHPWQHGLYVGLNDVNGIGFWTEGLGADRDKDGSFACRELKDPNTGWGTHAMGRCSVSGLRQMERRFS